MAEELELGRPRTASLRAEFPVESEQTWMVELIKNKLHDFL